MSYLSAHRKWIPWGVALSTSLAVAGCGVTTHEVPRDTDSATDSDTGTAADGDADVDVDAGSDGGLSEACLDAMALMSNLGCEFYATTLVNSGLEFPSDFPFALAIANAGADEVAIHIDNGPGGDVSNDYTVPPNDMIVVEDLPWIERLRSPVTGSYPNKLFASRKVPHAAYRIVSTAPVTVYQFNPFDFMEIVPGHDPIYSMTNDASLLLPAHIMKEEYIATSRPTLKVDHDGSGNWSTMPGFLAIAGTAAGTTVVEVTSTSVTLPSDLGSLEAIGALVPGEPTIFEIAPFEVVQFLSGVEPGCSNPVSCFKEAYPDAICCDTPRDFDLTGTSVRVVSGPSPAVFAGHDCAFVPFTTMACDHLEEQISPIVSWGTRYLCAHHETQSSEEPTIWRVVSGAEANTVSFVPATVHGPVTLGRGEYLEFESFDDFEIVATNRVAVAQFMVGQFYAESVTGDPSMSFVAPVDQFKTAYTFVAPNSFAHNYVSVIHAAGVLPTLDGVPLAGATAAIGDTHARTNAEIVGGVHRMESPEPFGITVYGVGQYASYMYPGGLGLDAIVVE